MGIAADLRRTPIYPKCRRFPKFYPCKPCLDSPLICSALQHAQQGPSSTSPSFLIPSFPWIRPKLGPFPSFSCVRSHSFSSFDVILCARRGEGGYCKQILLHHVAPPFFRGVAWIESGSGRDCSHHHAKGGIAPTKGIIHASPYFVSPGKGDQKRENFVPHTSHHPSNFAPIVLSARDRVEEEGGRSLRMPFPIVVQKEGLGGLGE